MIIDWLQKRLTLEDFLEEFQLEFPPQPKSRLQIILRGLDPWERMLRTMRPGDELWEYSSPPETWQRLRGMAGIALIRDGKVICSFRTSYN